MNKPENEGQNIDNLAKQLLQNAEESQKNIVDKQIADEEITEQNGNVANNSNTIAKTNDATNTKVPSKKIFEKWSVSDIVFLAIVTTITLLTGAVMPLLIHVPLFGIIQLGLSLQYSIFITIALMKVRKTGALLFMSVISGIVLVFMNPIMFAVLVLCALICELLAILISRGFKTTFSCILSAILYIPLSLPFLYIYYALMFPSTDVGAAVNAMRGGDVWVNIGMTAAVIALNALGAVIGYFISRELSKFAFYKK